MDDCIMSNNCTNKNKFCASDMSDKLVNLIETITKMNLEREKEVTAFDYKVSMYNVQNLFFFVNYFLRNHTISIIIFSFPVDKERS